MKKTFITIKERLVNAIQFFHNNKADFRVEDDLDGNEENGYAATINYVFHNKYVVSLCVVVSDDNRCCILSNIYFPDKAGKVPLSELEAKLLKMHMTKFNEIADKLNEELAQEEAYDEFINSQNN